jgi:hypothetical protein
VETSIDIDWVSEQVGLFVALVTEGCFFVDESWSTVIKTLFLMSDVVEDGLLSAVLTSELSARISLEVRRTVLSLTKERQKEQE